MSEFIYEKIKDSDGIDCYIKKGEIVRCKDCKHCESAPKWKDFELGCMLRREYTTATDYCSQAERKDDNDNQQQS